MARWRLAGINFEHFHMGDNLRTAFEHPDVEIVGVCDEKPERMADAVRDFGIPDDRVFTDAAECLARAEPDIVWLCPATAGRAPLVKLVAARGFHVILEKPFAATLAEADEMADAMAPTGKLFAINWPLTWSPAHRTAKRLIDEGLIGEPIEVHYYDGNRGPLWHTHDKVERTAEQVAAEKPHSWFYKKALGGGSMLDYMGYGTTFGTWYMNGKAPIEVTCVTDDPPGLEVDEHAIAIARYDCGLSKFETRWGTFTDPWTHQPQPKCGFVIVGTDGTLSVYKEEGHVRVQARDCPEGRDIPADPLTPPLTCTLDHVIDCLASGTPLEGPLTTKLSRIGQQIIDSAVLSAAEKRPVKLLA
ncbi:MAG: Gfo/Idh/MocA family oxidoreductase [Phycisphaerae bacterium]